jgi:uncharacterized membrane protein
VNPTVLLAAFFATAIEVIEMVAIVVGVGVARSWRASLLGASAGLIVLVALVAGLGTAVRDVPLTPVRLLVGALLLVFGLQWLRKGVLRVARDGWGVGHSAPDVDSADSGERGFDWTGFVLSFKGVSLEGLEVAVIVVAFGAAAGAVGSAVVGAAAAVLVLGALGDLPPGRPNPAAGATAVRRRNVDHLRHVLGRGRPWRGLARRPVGAPCPRGGLRRGGAGTAQVGPPLAARHQTSDSAAASNLQPVSVRDASMSSVLRGVRAFVMFWVDFVIGDDWTVAATVALALLGTWGLTRAGVIAWWLLPLAVLAITTVSLRRSVERELRHDQPG